MPSHHTPAPARAIAGRRLAWFFALVPILFALFVIAFVPEGERESSALDTLPVGADSTLAVELEEQLPDDEGQVAIVLWTADSGELDQATQDELTKQGTALLSQSAEQADGQGAPEARTGRRVRPAGRVRRAGPRADRPVAARGSSPPSWCPRTRPRRSSPSRWSPPPTPTTSTRSRSCATSCARTRPTAWRSR